MGYIGGRINYGFLKYPSINISIPENTARNVDMQLKREHNERECLRERDGVRGRDGHGVQADADADEPPAVLDQGDSPVRGQGGVPLTVG